MQIASGKKKAKQILQLKLNFVSLRNLFAQKIAKKIVIDFMGRKCNKIVKFKEKKKSFY